MGIKGITGGSGMSIMTSKQSQKKPETWGESIVNQFEQNKKAEQTRIANRKKRKKRK